MNDLPTFDALLSSAGLSRIEARALLEIASGKRREWLIAHGDESPTDACSARFRNLAIQRRQGVPLAYLTGTREFFGRNFAVTPAVLIPRHETEQLVAWAIRHCPRHAHLLELGVGSGAIAITLALERPDLIVTATDQSEAALALAQRNAQRLGARQIRFTQGDWWQALPARERFDVVLSNPPYLASGDEHLARGDLRHEPTLALASGNDGLDAIRTIIGGAPGHLNHGGRIVLEHGWDQADCVAALLARSPLSQAFSLRDDAGHWRIAGATLIEAPDR